MAKKGFPMMTGKGMPMGSKASSMLGNPVKGKGGKAPKKAAC